MASGNCIVVSANPHGKFGECTISGTPKPGTFLELLPATVSVAGRFTMRAVTRATGARGGVCILDYDRLQGKTVDDAYVTGTRAFTYWPIAGEELNGRVASVAGTADDVAIGDLFGIEQTTGMLKANSSYTSAPFAALEAITDPTVEYLLHVLYLGNQS